MRLKLLLAFLAAAGCSRTNAPPRPAVSSQSLGGVPKSARSRPPGVSQPVPHFSDVTTAAGIRFRHTTGGFGRKLMPEPLGSGCAFLDFDGAGRLDFLLLNGRPLQGTTAAATRSAPTLALYRNSGDGTFTDVTRAAGLAVPMYGMGCSAADYDNDRSEERRVGKECRSRWSPYH